MKLSKKLTVGIDIGGTFTDFVVLKQSSGEVFTWKALTTPENPSKGVIEGLKECFSNYNMSINNIDKLVHGTTLVTNAIIERKGAKTGLITTKGFRDVLEIGREIRYDLYDLFMKRPSPLVSREFVKEIQNRNNPDLSEEKITLNSQTIISSVSELLKKGVESIAISFIHSLQANKLEKEAEDILRKQFPDLYISRSSDVANEIGEFERTSTVVANAYVKPLMDKYLSQLENKLKALDFKGRLYIMLSSGGFCDINIARQYPIRLLESGPAAGTLSAAYWGSKTNNPKVIGFDMGGTTAKAGLIIDGEAEKTFEFEAGRVHRFKRGSGLPIRTPTVDLIEIGAGGGSIAHVDNLGLMKVGPQSSSSNPGPACYGLGGLDPTVTDANLLLGYLNPDFFLGGTMKIKENKSEESIVNKLSSSFDLDTYTSAWGVHAVVNENMSQAARIYTIEKGEDHRKYTLVATGGGGPVHAYGIAKNLGLNKIIYPFAAGVSSAIGMIVVPAREDFSQAFSDSIFECDWGEVNNILSSLEKSGRKRLTDAGVSEKHIKITRMADIQYEGQGNSVTIPLPTETINNSMNNKILRIFEGEYKKLYSNTVQGGRPEFVNLRLVAESTEIPPEFYFHEQTKSKSNMKAEEALKGYRSIYLPKSEGENGIFQSVPVYNRYYLQQHNQLTGPCVIEEKESTIIINGSASVYVDEFLNVIAEI